MIMVIVIWRTTVTGRNGEKFLLMWLDRVLTL